MFKGLQAASARFNLRSTMDRVNGKMGAGTGNVLDATMASKDIIKGLFIDLTFLVDTWNPEVKDLPPEKVIRDFNVFLFSGKYDLFVTNTLANTISHLDDKKIETFSSLLNYYFSAYGEKDCKEKKLIQNFVNQIIKGLERQSSDRKTGQGFLKNFINNQTIKWSLDDDLTKKEIEESLNEALNKRNNNALAIIESVNKKIELKQFQEGIIQANKGLEIHKDNLLLYVARARCFYESGYMKSAINDFTKSIELDNDLNNSIFHKYRGLAKLQINDKEGALNDFKIAAGRGNDDAKELLNIYFKNKDNFSSDKKVFPEKEKELNKEIPGFEKRIDEKEIKMDEHEYFTRAFEKHKLEDFQGAINDNSKAIEINPSFAEAFFNRAECKREIEDDSGAIDDFTKAIEINPRMSQAYNNRGFVKAKLGDFKGAIDDFTKTIEINPRNQNAYLNRGIEKDKLEDFQGAIDDYSKAIEINQNFDKAFFNRAVSKRKIEDYSGAIDDYTKALEIYPRDQNAYNNRGTEKNKLKDFKGAIDDYSKAIKIDPNFATAFFNRAVSKKKIEDFQGAIDDYKKVIEINPKDQLANQKLKEIEEYLRQKASSKSINDNKKATGINPKDAEAEAYYNLGIAKFRLEDFQGAIDNYTKAIEINPTKALIYLSRGKAKFDSGDLEGSFDDVFKAKELGSEDAIQLLKKIRKEIELIKTKAIENDPSNSEAYYTRANSKLHSEDVEGAIEDLNKAIEINPSYKDAYNFRGLIKSQLKDFSEAIDDYSKAIEINSKDEDAYKNRATSKCYLKDYEGAIADYKKAIEINPRDAESYHNLGLAKINLEDFEGAIYNLKKAIEINPIQAESYLFLGNARVQSEDFATAMDDYTKAIEINPSYTDAYFYRGITKLKFEDFEGAIADVKKAQELGSEDANEFLKEIEEKLREDSFSNSEESGNSAKILKEHFDKEISLNDEANKNIIQDISKWKEDKKISSSSSTNKPIKRDAIQNVLETKLDNFNPTYKTWATFKALKRLAWVMEDDGSDEEELYSFLLSSYKNVSSPAKFTEWIKELLYDNSYSNNDPEWLESEWNIGPNIELHAFNSKESFLKSFDSEFTYSIFSKCWEIACSEDLYKLNDYENWNKNKYWFF